MVTVSRPAETSEFVQTGEFTADGEPVGECQPNPTPAFGTAQVNVRPVITSIAPGRGLIGNTTAVTISGRGFGASPSVQAGTGITANVTSASNTQIQANFVIAPNAPGGNHSVTVKAGGQPSNSVNFFVQVPSTFGEVSVTTSNEVCSPGTAGRFSDVRYEVRDQANNPIQVAGMKPQENITLDGNEAFPGFLPFATPSDN
ncbi:MAG: IPT/TIG domain-containing protein [Candidatus Acidiferrales bacterium]